MKGLRWFDQSTLVVWRKHLSACPFSLASRPFLLGIPAPCLWESSPLSSKEKTPFFGRPHAFPWEDGTRPLGEEALFTACAASKWLVSVPPAPHLRPLWARSRLRERQAGERTGTAPPNPRLGTAERRRAEQSPTAQAFCRRKRGKTICRVQACSRPDLPLGRGGAREVPRVRSSTGRHRKSCFVCNQW